MLQGVTWQASPDIGILFLSPPQLLLVNLPVTVDVNLVAQHTQSSLRLLWTESIEIFCLLLPQDGLMIVVIVAIIQLMRLVR